MAEDQNKLTQFAPPSTDTKSSQSFFSRIFGKGTGTVPDSSPVAYTPSARNIVSIKVSGRESPSLYRDQYSNTAESSNTPTNKKRVVRTELRTFANVLGRLMNILDKKSSFSEGLKPYKDSEFRQSWMPDSSCKECYDCGNQFATFLRRHHCRICGQIFCSSCCNQEVPGRVIGFEGGLRACTYCCGVVSGLMGDSDDDLGTLRDNLKAQLSNSTPIVADLRGTGSSNTFSPTRRFSTSDSFEMPSTRIASVFDLAPTQEPMEDMTFEERQSLVKDSVQLKSLFFEMLDPVDGVQLTSKRHRLRVYPDCFHGNELMTWLVDSDKAQDYHQAVIIGQALLDAKYVLCLTDFNLSTYSGDYTLYQFRELTHDEYRTKDLGTRRLSAYPEIVEEVPNWIQELEQSELHGFVYYAHYHVRV